MLSKLRSQAPAHSFIYIHQAIEVEFPRPLHEIFSHFEKVPLASGSIAQIHVAILNGSKSPTSQRGTRDKTRIYFVESSSLYHRWAELVEAIRVHVPVRQNYCLANSSVHAPTFFQFSRLFAKIHGSTRCSHYLHDTRYCFFHSLFVRLTYLHTRA